MDPSPQAVQTANPRHGRARLIFVVLLTIAGAVAAGYMASRAWYSVYSNFQDYDDEGYVMITVSEWLAGRSLYDEVYSQYGPFFYFFKYVLHLCGVPLTHDATRLVSMVVWAATAVLAGAWTFSATRSILLSPLVLLWTFVILCGFSNEPGHPQSLCAFLTAALLLTGTTWEKSRRRVPGLLLHGVLLGAVFLTKLNIGIYAGYATAVTLALRAPQLSRLKWSGPALLLGGLVVPVLVMRWQIHQTSVAGFIIVSSVSFVFAGLVAFRQSVTDRVKAFSAAEAVAIAVGFAGCIVLLVAFVCGRGTSSGALLHSLVVTPQTMARDILFFGWPSELSNVVLPITVSGVLCCVHLLAAPRWRQDMRLRFEGVLKVVFVAVVVFRFPVELRQQLDLSSRVLFRTLPFLWIVMLPGSDKSTFAHSRLYLAYLALFQTLVVFPIAGSQLIAATFLFVPCAALCWHDVASVISTAARNGVRFARLSTAVASVVPVVAVVCLLLPGHDYERDYSQSVPLNLAGATKLRVPPATAGRLHWLCENLRAQSDGYYMIPGIPSTHFWTGIPPVNGFNGSSWVLLFDRSIQQQIVADLSRRERPVIVVRRDLLQFWMNLGRLRMHDVFELMEDDYEPRLVDHGFEILFPRSRSTEAARESWLLFGRRSFGNRQSIISLPQGMNHTASEGAALVYSGRLRTTFSGGVLGFQSFAWTHKATASPALSLEVTPPGVLAAFVGNDRVLTGPAVNRGDWHSFEIRIGSHISLSVDGRDCGTAPFLDIGTLVIHGQLGASFTRTGENNHQLSLFDGEIENVTVRRKG